MSNPTLHVIPYKIKEAGIMNTGLYYDGDKKVGVAFKSFEILRFNADNSLTLIHPAFCFVGVCFVVLGVASLALGVWLLWSYQWVRP